MEWCLTKIKDLTLKDALDAMSDGFYLIGGDGGVQRLTNEPGGVLNVYIDISK